MAKTTLIVKSTDDFDSTIEDALDKGRPVFVIFVSTLNEEGEMWCPDCRVSDPVFKRAFRETPNHVLVKCSIEREGYKGNPNHPYRLHPQIQIKSIPTLMSWKADSQSKLPDDQCGDYEKVIAFIKANI